MHTNDFSSKRVSVIETVALIREAFLLCAHNARTDTVLNFYTNEFHLHDKLVSLHSLLRVLNSEDATPELLNLLIDVVDWTNHYNIICAELNRAVVNANFARIDNTDHIESFRRALMHTRTPQATKPKPVKSVLDFIREKVATLSPDELRVFLSMERGKRLPAFIEDWRAELPYTVSNKTFSNSLSRARNSFRAETKRSKRKK